MELKDKIPRQIYREIKNLKGLLMLSYIFLVLLLLLPFLTWPGFGSTIFLSQLDIFLLENYPLWFIFIVSFFYRFLCEFYLHGLVSIICIKHTLWKLEVTRLEILFDDIYFSFYNYFSSLDTDCNPNT